MATESERILIHYSKKKLTELENDGTSNQRGYHYSNGKPDGFWYAYGEVWKQLINSGKARRDKENTSIRYEFRLPDSAFVKTIADVSPHTIFELSSGNLDEFMQQFVREEHHIYMTNDKIIEHALYVMLQDADSAILNELSCANQPFRAYYTKLKKQLNRQLYSGKEINFEKVIANINTTFPTLLSTFPPSKKALKSDGIFLFNWRAFWKTVSESVGGVEFQEDLLTINVWNDLELTWTHPIAIHSGVIFKPSIFRGGILMEQLRMQTTGGKRYTRKKKSKRSTRKC
jgi:hypothetical protein